MRPAVVTAVLLLVGIINTVTAVSPGTPWRSCAKYPAVECAARGWMRFNGKRCMKYILFQKTFQEAQKHCQSLDSELLSIHDEDEKNHAKCMSLYFSISPDPVPFWIGAQRSGDGFKYTDGTEFNYTNWLPKQPDNYLGQEDCVEANVLEWGMWNDSRCSGKKNFVCMKKK